MDELFGLAAARLSAFPHLGHAETIPGTCEMLVSIPGVPHALLKNPRRCSTRLRTKKNIYLFYMRL